MARKPVTSYRLLKEMIEQELFPIIQGWGFVRSTGSMAVFGWDPGFNGYAWDFIHEDHDAFFKYLSITYANNPYESMVNIRYIIIPNTTPIPNYLVIDPDFAENNIKTLEDLTTSCFDGIRTRIHSKILYRRWIPFYQSKFFNMKHTKDLVLAEKRAKALIESVKDNLWKVHDYFFKEGG